MSLEYMKTQFGRCGPNHGEGLPAGWKEPILKMAAGIFKRSFRKAGNPGVIQAQGVDVYNPAGLQDWTGLAGFVANRVFPARMSVNKGDKVRQWDRQSLLRLRGKVWADGGPPERLDDALGPDQSYVTQVYGGRLTAGDQAVANQSEGLNIIAHKLAAGIRAAMTSVEDELFRTVFKAGVWESPGTDVTPPQKWSNRTNGTPLKDIRDAARNIMRVYPGPRSDLKLLINPDVMEALRQHPDFKGIDAVATLIAPEQRIAFACDIGEVIVGYAAKSDTEEFAGKHALLYAAPMSKDAGVPTAATRYYWTGFLGNASLGVYTNVMRDPMNYNTCVDVGISNAWLVQSPILGRFWPDVVA